MQGKCALVSGAARRIGAAISRALHEAGANVAVHYRGSKDEADALCAELNDKRADSAASFQADLGQLSEIEALANAVNDWSGRLDVLVNNASSFYPTPIGSVSLEAWEDLMGSNLKAPIFLTQALLLQLKLAQGCVINIVDIHARRPLRDHVVYGSAKAGLAMLTRSLAKDLAPDIRVNGVAPGAIVWPENGMTEPVKESILEQIPLGRQGCPDDIANAVVFLARDAAYITGQVISVDGGRSIGW